MYAATTHHIRIIALPTYLVDQSNPEEGSFVWAYTIQIENRGQRTVQLLNRTWHITDAGGQVQEVHGAGVIGEQPVLEPGQAFQYTSGAVLNTPSGIMSGSYEMVDAETGERFDVAIPIFSLDSPAQLVRPN